MGSSKRSKEKDREGRRKHHRDDSSDEERESEHKTNVFVISSRLISTTAHKIQIMLDPLISSYRD